MKQFIVLCALVAVACGAWNGGLRGSCNGGLYARDDPAQDSSKNYFPVPTSVEQAKAMSWQLLDRPKGPMPELVMYCAIERNLCALYDDLGNAAGLQVAIPQDEHTDAVTDWTIQGFTAWSPPPRDGESAKTYWTLQQYFVSEETLKRSVEERQKARDQNQVLQEDGVWLTGFNGTLLKVPRTIDEIRQSHFTIQACYKGMGTHCYYNMSKTTPCTSNAWFPWFLLVSDGQLVGSGFMSFGKLPVKEGQKDWFERQTEAAVKFTVPGGPQCLYDLTRQPGLVTMHIYYVDKPSLITCPASG